MSTVVEDPGIPLVGRNGGFQMYTEVDGLSQCQPPTGKRPGKYENVGYRLAKRKELFQRRKVICDFSLGFALVGIVLMVIETELCIAGVYTKEDTPSLLIKTCITISTVTLLGFVVWYHALDIKLFMCDNSLDDWRLAMSSGRICRIALELVVYAVHPIPGNYDIPWTTFDANTEPKSETVPIDVIISIPMFLRLNLVCRVIMLHSKLFTDASSQSLGALNRIHFNFKFIFKSMMTLYPEYILLVLMTSAFLVASWLLRACEVYHDDVHRNFLNSMWLIAITFLSVGYGDIVPHSYCGRTVAVLTGIFGAGCTALVVAVLARKLELSRAEKYVHNFVIDVELDKRYKVAAANIVKAGWFVYKNKKLGRCHTMRKNQRKLLKAIHSIREVKQEQRRLVDSGVTLVEMFKSQNTLNTGLQRVETFHENLEGRITYMEQRLASIDNKLDGLFSYFSQQRS
ncbi:hypothetical protein LSH36_867g00034 [Paralvinella palmiformis]|uniref:Calmodulin-binding domain-containing protein n=1 Tax=Paralvinella palmiformis TaxID=53620 RepID=A0AAD9MT56_9ANNE|nr:hypothetical protein LSH36_867g00034 [Paralvinella palmiformis]